MVATPPDFPFAQMTKAKDYPEKSHSCHDQGEAEQESYFAII